MLTPRSYSLRAFLRRAFAQRGGGSTPARRAWPPRAYGGRAFTPRAYGGGREHP